MRFSFYVGSTDTHDAHKDWKRASDPIRVPMAATEWSYGVWNGETEKIAVYEAELASNAVAQRIAYAISIMTGNECVMVTRDVEEREEHPAFNSIRRYRANAETRTEGNRTMAPGGTGLGWALTPDVRGQYVAYLVWQDASVTPVTEG